MRGRLGLCFLGLLCLHSSVFGQEAAEVRPGVLIFCDDPSVENAVHKALDKFNAGLMTGHKLALFQITTATKTENGSDSLYSLVFTSMRSDCVAGSDKPWTECDYLPSNKEPISCNASVHVTETEADVRQVDCELDDHIVPERAPCLGCPQEIDVNSEDLKSPLSLSITKYNSISDSTHLFTLHAVGHATRQVVAGFRYKVRFDMRKTVCAKADHAELSDLCVPDDENREFANCNSTVDVAPWRHELPQANMVCDQGALMMIYKRRPAGWSPLRNILFTMSTLPPPTTAIPKEESSEEDTTAPNPPAASDVAPTTDAVDTPFHCPSKPWKPLKAPGPAEPAATEAVVEEVPTEGTPAEGFSDTDLLR